MRPTKSPPASNDHGEDPNASRLCSYPGCDCEGTFRAPRTRDKADGFYWFCLDHVRAYNKAWDYFAGMTRDEIEKFQRDVSTWHRPTWPFGAHPGFGNGSGDMDDPFGMMGEAHANRAGGREDGRDGAAGLPLDQRRALETLNLEARASLQQIKSRYKQLVKRFHPDANGGDPAAEERLKEINQAYEFLMSCGYS